MSPEYRRAMTSMVSEIEEAQRRLRSIAQKLDETRTGVDQLLMDVGCWQDEPDPRDKPQLARGALARLAKESAKLASLVHALAALDEAKRHADAAYLEAGAPRDTAPGVEARRRAEEAG